MNTKALRQKILDLAIHGKLVPQDPNDEPASVLLERIKTEKERLIKEGKIKRAKRSKATCDKPHYENEAPFEVPSSWTWCKLGELCVFLSRGKSPKYLDEDRRYPVFAQKCNLKEGGVSLAQARFLDPTTIEKWDEVYKLRTGDVLVNSTGTGTVGRTRLFNESCLGDYPFVVPDSHVSVVRTADEIVSEYIYAYMSSNVVQEYLEDNLAGSTNQKELYIGVLDSLQIALPPYVEQKRIVSEIEKWYKASEVIKNGKSDLERLIKQTKSKILDLAIHGKLVPQDPTDEPAAELLKRINPKAVFACDNAQYGKLPKGWTYCSLQELTTKIFAGGDKPSTFSKIKTENCSIPVYSNGIENRGLYGYTDIAQVFEKCLTISARGTIGFTCIRLSPFVPIVRLVVVIPNSCVHLDYLKYCFDKILQMSEGSSIPQLTVPTMKNFLLPLPPLNEQHRIVSKIEELFAQLDKIEASL